MGLTGCYRRFIQGYGVIAKPLTELLRKERFKWSATSIHAFEQLKVALISAPVLKLPNFTKSFVVETDASSMGIGAVLMQEGHPIAFVNKALSPRRQSLSVYEKELLAIIFAVKHWHYYLITRRFTIRTN